MLKNETSLTNGTYFAFFVEADFPYLFFPWKLDSSFLGLNIVFNKLLALCS